MLRRRTPQRVTCAPEGPARPQRTVTPSPGERGSLKTLAQAERTSSQGRYCFSPRERRTTEPANRMWLARCTVSSYLVSTSQQNEHHCGPCGSSRDTPHYCRSNGVACGGLQPPLLSRSSTPSWGAN